MGHRLALAAYNVAYGDAKVVAAGPLYQTPKTTGNQAPLTLGGGVGGGLVAKGGGPLTGFTGADRRFVPAQARPGPRGGGRVVVRAHVAAPVAVRYAWADNPEGANLYNKKGLPASTFTTE